MFVVVIDAELGDCELDIGIFIYLFIYRLT